MTNQEFRTLAYTKSPKTSRRTTFQDELQAAVSARATKSKTDQYSDDFGEDEDDFLKELLKSRQKKSKALKVGKSKAKINDFELSDDEGKHGRTKRVSFLKTQKSPSKDTMASEPHENEPPDCSTGGYNDDSLPSQHSANVSEDNVQFNNGGVESTEPQTPRENSSKSLSYQTSDDTLLDLPLPLPSDSSVVDSPGPGVSESTEERKDLSETDLKHKSSADSVNEREPPRPKPRQRNLGLSFQTPEKIAEDAESQDTSRPQTSSASIPLSTDTSSNITKLSSSHWAEGDHAGSPSFSKSSSNRSEQSQLFTKSTVDSGSRDDFISDDSKEQERKYSTSFEEFHESRRHSDHFVAQVTHVLEKSPDSRTSSSHSKSSQRPQSAGSRKIESKYLGSLKVLDREVSLQESPPQGADSLRAAIYQEWLKKKKEKLRENMLLKKKEELLKEKKKQEEEAKKEEAVASYEAWKENKAQSLKAKAKEKQDVIRKEQRAIEERERKKESATQVFEKWKQEHDHLLKEKYRKQREAESKLQLNKHEKEEERMRDSRSAFSDWCEKKKDSVNNKVTMERKETKSKAEEEQYMKEERDKVALEMYEHWLTRKELEHKRMKEERRIQAILQDSPPPPWSPPSKTIPFRK
ncbi:microtubule-associated protein 9 [Scomber scombrus]|uniref:microtubule-associated protein 9 n=1 Tax=Scomber scombrus TaxID=13677 RepID=UPI002DDAE51B|nr:microtubule-associated protein 9 [Scomber scombrus]